MHLSYLVADIFAVRIFSQVEDRSLPSRSKNPMQLIERADWVAEVLERRYTDDVIERGAFEQHVRRVSMSYIDGDTGSGDVLSRNFDERFTDIQRRDAITTFRHLDCKVPWPGSHLEHLATRTRALGHQSSGLMESAQILPSVLRVPPGDWPFHPEPLVCLCR